MSNHRPCIYRHFDKEGNLLYVGATQELFSRTMQHQKCSDWFKDISTITIEHFLDVTIDVIKEKEVLYIFNENPRFNKLIIVPKDRLEKKQLRVKKALVWLTDEWQECPYMEISTQELNSLVKIGLAESKLNDNRRNVFRKAAD